ncbi:MAG: cyclic pyranopterin monophosphate synthase MoaC [Acidimicrobiales bacterium]|nr:cyclic pyranopterin monophosphate synthase MoaC [Acidimicrobiales bacterium]MDP6298986.1 cyclic pyranopterin monophosphate synthase MoaC [Acidimicrobiales bacterium]HJM28498.1 cyclic pyranopterin monophosphate synthase MoaC [Acidimicrobiales bacterium]HJM97772.1 cyclic pyranopterin monophosphate synthase MoaC [Acidimicrobiales bacterium]
MTEQDFTHLNSRGEARMVDVSPKEPTLRRALAKAKIFMSKAALKSLSEGTIVKGDVFAIARVAGIQAAKKTSELIPLCHPLMLNTVKINFAVDESNISIEAEVTTVSQTGVEMEALSACSIAALTIYDMCKSVDKEMVITDLALWEKTGGKSGPYKRV